MHLYAMGKYMSRTNELRVKGRECGENTIHTFMFYTYDTQGRWRMDRIITYIYIIMIDGFSD